MKPSQSPSHSAIEKNVVFFPHSMPIKMQNVDNLISTKYSSPLHSTEWIYLHPQRQPEPFLRLEKAKEQSLYSLITYLFKML